MLAARPTAPSRLTRPTREHPKPSRMRDGFPERRSVIGLPRPPDGKYKSRRAHPRAIRPGPEGQWKLASYEVAGKKPKEHCVHAFNIPRRHFPTASFSILRSPLPFSCRLLFPLRRGAGRPIRIPEVYHRGTEAQRKPLLWFLIRSPPPSVPPCLRGLTGFCILQTWRVPER